MEPIKEHPSEFDINEELEGQFEYVVFWWRFLASIIDTVCILIIFIPLMSMLVPVMSDQYAPNPFGLNVLLQYLLPALATILFWVYKSATPGKMILGIEIVNAADFGKPSTGQFIDRYFSYYLSTLVFGLGFIWVAFDKKKQGWHDKLASTVVIKTK